MTEPLLHPHRSHFDAGLQKVRDGVTSMGEQVDRSIARAMWGLTDRAVDICNAVIEDDRHINDSQRDVRELCYTITLTQAPVAGDLREIMSLLHISSELERMGDHCVSIAKIARALADLPDLVPDVSLSRMAELCSDQVRGILGAVVGRDIDRARQVAARDDRIDRVYHRLFDELVQRMIDDGNNVYRATNLVFIAHHLERIADRVTNIAEDLVFLQTGVIEELG